MSEYKEIKTSHSEKGSRGRIKTYISTQLIWLIFGILEALLGLRFIFKLIGANPQNTFAEFLYNVTGFFLVPFANLTPEPSANGLVLEISTLIAMAVYALIGWALERAVYVIFFRPQEGVESRQTVVHHETSHSMDREKEDTRPN